jgi:imidazolonepropionase-like amidohydrolase
MTMSNSSTPLDQKVDWLAGKGWVWPTNIRPQIIKTNWMFDSKQGRILNGMAIHISDGRIDAIDEISTIASSPNGTLDLSKYYVIPGLIDAHAHLSSIYDPFEPNAYLTIAAANSATLTTHILRNSQRCLRMGITCIRDMPGFTNFFNQESIAVRDASERGLITVPRIVAFGWVEPTAGHMDLALPAKFRNDASIYADGPYEVQRMVRRMIREGVDGFKTAISGGLGGRMEEIWWEKFDDTELLCLTKTAHGVGKRVAVHAHTDASIRQGLRCNVDTIEHGVYMEKETADIMAEKGIPLVPTLAVSGDRALERAKSAGAVSPHQIKKRRSLIASDQRRKTVRLAFEQGVILATGTDAYFTLRGDYWGKNNEEVQLMIKAGVPPTEALKAATLGASLAVGFDEIGALEKGRYADMVGLTKSPLDDPICLTDPDCVAIVILGGQVIAGSFDGLNEVRNQMG